MRLRASRLCTCRCTALSTPTAIEHAAKSLIALSRRPDAPRPVVWNENLHACIATLKQSGSAPMHAQQASMPAQSCILPAQTALELLKALASLQMYDPQLVQQLLGSCLHSDSLATLDVHQHATLLTALHQLNHPLERVLLVALCGATGVI